MYLGVGDRIANGVFACLETELRHVAEDPQQIGPPHETVADDDNVSDAGGFGTQWREHEAGNPDRFQDSDLRGGMPSVR